MKREYKLYLTDILESIGKIEDYTDSLNFEDFSKNDLVIDAVVRNLEIIGEATGQLPEEFKTQHNEIDWRKVKDFRNVVTHKYWQVDKEIVWDIIQNKLDDLKEKIQKIDSKKK